MSKLVSVIVPIYNVDLYLAQCIESIINQTLKQIEVILVDDGSTDRSGLICDYYANNDTRIKVIHKANGGLVNARKTGLHAATSGYIVYIDGDDWIELDALERMYNRIVSVNSEIVKYGHFENTGQIQKLVLNRIISGLYCKDELVECVYPRLIAGEDFYEWQVFPSLCDMIIKRELLEKEQYKVDDDITIGEDASCTFPCMLLAERVFFSDESFYHYRQYGNSMIKSLPSRELLRRQYAILHTYVSKRLFELREIYDLTEQWMDHIIFSMIPRASILFDGIETKDYVFPFRNIIPNSRVILYCAGTYGQLLYKYLVESKCCEVVLWCDRNYVELKKQGFDVSSPDIIRTKEFDSIIVASMFASDRKEIVSFLKKEYSHIEIGVIDPDFVRSDEVKRGFRLI